MTLLYHTHHDALLITAAVTVVRYLPLAQTAVWTSLSAQKFSAEHFRYPSKSLPSSLALR